MSISNEQLAAIQNKVSALVADKADADQKTQVSNQADTDASAAVAAASQAKLDEAASDAKVAGDLQDLTSFLDSLVSTPAGK